MKRILLIVGLLFITFQLESQTLNIKKAIVDKKIEYSLSGSWDNSDDEEFQDADGQYFGKCMTIIIRNKSTDTIWVYIENGLMLMCEDTTTQDMINTKPIYVHLQPKEKKKIQLYAMCTEFHDGMPTKNLKYTIGKVADNNLVKITQSIEDMFMNNIVGQGAVWAYTDNVTEKDLRKYGATNNSIKLTIELLNKANVFTQINKQIKTIVKKKKLKHALSEERKNDKNEIVINKPFFYFLNGLSILAIMLIIGLLIRIKKNNL